MSDVWPWSRPLAGPLRGLRVATWNLQRSSAISRRERIGAWMRDIDADVWILTETRVDIAPGPEFASPHPIEIRHSHGAGEVWTMIWSRLSIHALGPVADPERGLSDHFGIAVDLVE